MGQEKKNPKTQHQRQMSHPSVRRKEIDQGLDGRKVWKETIERIGGYNQEKGRTESIVDICKRG